MATRVPGHQTFGSALAQGLGSGLDTLANIKLKEVIERQKQKRDEKVLREANFTPEAAAFISTLPSDQRLKYIEGRPGLMNQPEQNQQLQQLQQGSYLPQEQQQLGQQDIFASLNPRSQANPAQQQLERLRGSSGEGFLNSLLAGQGQPGAQPGLMQPQQMQQPQKLQQARPQVSPQQAQRRQSVAEILTAPVVSAAERNAELKSSQAERNAQLKDQLKINAEGREIADNFSKFGAVAEDIKKQIPNLKKIINSGHGGSKTWAGIVGLGKKLGLDLSSHLATNDAKIASSRAIFFPLIASILKENFTDQEFKAFEEKLPKETDSDEIQLYKLDNIGLILDEAKRRAHAAERLTQKYGNKFPTNFRQEVYKEADKHSAKSKNPEIDLLPNPATESPDSSFELSNGEVAKIVDGEWRIV